MVRGRDRDKGETRGSARRAWLAGLLVWTFLFQSLLPVLGPVRLGDGTATAALGRLLPICTAQGLRLAEPATSDSQDGGTTIAIDGGWHCLLCVTPQVAPMETAVLPTAPAAARFSWTTPPPDAPAQGRERTPQSARGPPLTA